MIIHSRKIRKKKNELRVEAEIEFRYTNQNKHLLWFEVDSKYKKIISKNMDCFLLSVLIMAMYYKENIYVDGDLSPKLIENINSIQEYFYNWQPDKLKIIKVEYKKKKIQKCKKKQSAMFFSGGVDSFYSLNRLIESGCVLDKAIFLQGYDISLKDNKTFSTASNIYEDYLRDKGVELIRVKTNQREVHGSEVIWAWTSGTILTSIALFLSPGFETLYIPASISYGYTEPWGTNPITDELCSLEHMQIIYHGSDMRRMDKIKEVAKNKDSYDKLRVCLKNPNGIENCCMCEKCIRTMIAFEIVNKLTKYKTFNNDLFKVINNLKIQTNSQRSFIEDLISEARKEDKSEIAEVLENKLKG